MVEKYRKKPVVIEAMQFIEETKDQVFNWVQGQRCEIFKNEEYVLVIETLEGPMRVEIGDFVIKGIEGEFYPCKPGIFEKTYELVEKP